MSRPFKFCPRCAQPLVTAMHGEAQRHACPDAKCGFVHWNNPVPVVAAIVEQDGLIILGRNRNWPEKFFALITGFLEKDEQPEEAVLREVEEELGLKARDPTFVGHYIFPQLNQLILAYHVQAEPGEVKLGEELADYRKLPPEKLRPWPAATGLALRDWLVSKGYQPEVRPHSPLFEILNFLPLGERFGTAGQPAAKQFGMIRDAGFGTVINLALATSTGALPDEERIVAGLGMRYVHIPVEFQAPALGDLRRFFDAVDAAGDGKVFVHCAMNMRVSAFMFLHRVLKQGMPVAEAEMALHRIWTPDPTWQAFIDQALRGGADAVR